MNELPVRFSEKIKQAAGQGGGYPYQLSAEDLDLNFAYCAIEVDESSGLEFESVNIQGGLPGRRLAYRPARPFQVLRRITPGTNIINFGVINTLSRVFNGLTPNSKIDVAGLLNLNRTQGWFTMPVQSKIYLELTFAPNTSVTGCEIKFGTGFDMGATPWTSGSIVEENTDGQQTKARKLIAFTESGEGGKPQLFQVMSSQQVLQNVCINGKAARYPYAHEGGYPF
jgi:hypothetical protein